MSLGHMRLGHMLSEHMGVDAYKVMSEFKIGRIFNK